MKQSKCKVYMFWRTAVENLGYGGPWLIALPMESVYLRWLCSQ